MRSGLVFVENVSPLTMLSALECGFPHSIIHLPMDFSMVRGEMSSKGQVQIPHPEILERELECGIPHSIIHIPMQFSMVRNEVFSKGQFHVAHHEILEEESECGIPHSIIHIPMHFSMVRGEIFSKGQFHVPHPEILEWGLECGIPHSIIHIPMHFSVVRGLIVGVAWSLALLVGQSQLILVAGGQGDPHKSTKPPRMRATDGVNRCAEFLAGGVRGWSAESWEKAGA